MLFIVYIVLRRNENKVCIFDCDNLGIKIVTFDSYNSFAKYNYCVQKEFKVLKNIITAEAIFNSFDMYKYKFIPLVFKNNEYLLFEISTGLIHTLKAIPTDMQSMSLNVLSKEDVKYRLFDSVELTLNKKVENNLIFYEIPPDVPDSTVSETVTALKGNQLALIRKYRILNGHDEFAFISTCDKALTVKYRTIVKKLLEDYNLASINNLCVNAALCLDVKGVLTTSYAWCSLIESWRQEKNVGLIYARYNTSVPNSSEPNYDLARRLAEECCYLFYALYLDAKLSRPDIVMNSANIDIKRMYSLNSALISFANSLALRDSAYCSFVSKCNNFLNQSQNK